MARHSPYRLLPEGLTMKNGELANTFVGTEYGQLVEKRGSAWKVAGTVVVAGLVAWLLGVTVVRELQLSAVHRDLGKVKTDVDRLQVEVARLTQLVDREKSLLTDVNVYDDGVFAELDSSEVVEDSLSEQPRPAPAVSRRRHPAPADSSQLESITVDDDDDDDDDYEYEDGESGWYQDYDHRKKEGTSSLVHLQPDRFLGKVLSVRPSDSPARPSKLNELRRILHQTNAELGAETSPPPSAASSTDKVAERSRRSLADQSPPEEYVDEFAARQYSRNNRRRGKGEIEQPAEFEHAAIEERDREEISRHTRNSEDEGYPSSRRAFIAAHFHGNTSHLNPDFHPHYKGNGLVQVAHDAPHNLWWPSGWTRAAPHPAAPALTRRGHVRVRHTGIYLVYVQIYYLDAHDVTGWVLHRHSPDGADDERESLLQCATTSPSDRPRDKPNSCYSAAALLLAEGDLLVVRNTGGDRHSLMQPEKSFIGLVKLADAETQPDY